MLIRPDLYASAYSVVRKAGREAAPEHLESVATPAAGLSASGHGGEKSACQLSRSTAAFMLTVSSSVR